MSISPAGETCLLAGLTLALETSTESYVICAGRTGYWGGQSDHHATRCNQ